ncbi:jhy protein homolog [Paroedura picta]|uniref:jhy protein homolog n=1 Tax=Paroedura picta TaxID=143630 RepID=UPI00405767B6
MDRSRPSQNGLTQPHVPYTFLKTASEGLFLTEEDFHSGTRDSLESDAESLAREQQYQLELQQRIRNSEELLNQSYYEMEEDSLEEDSLEEEKPLSDLEESEVARIPTRSNCGKEDCGDNQSKEETTDRYSGLRYHPNGKDEGEGLIVELKKSGAEDARASPFSLTRAPSQDRLTATDHHLPQEQQAVPSVPDKESLDNWVPSVSVSDGSCPSPKNWEQENKEAEPAWRYNGSSSLNARGCRTQVKDFKPQRSKKDFIGKNKVTLGLATQQNNSYLQLYSKKQRDGHPGQVHQSKGPETRGTDPSLGPPLKESSLQDSAGAQVELRDQPAGHHNELEFENTPTNSSSSRVPNLEQDIRSLLPCGLPPSLPAALLWPSVATGTQDTRSHTKGVSFALQDGKEASMNLTFARYPLLLGSYQNLPGLHLPCSGENHQEVQQNTQNSSGCQQRFPRRCAFSEPRSLPGHGKHRNPLEDKKIASACDPGIHPRVNKGLSSWNSGNIYREDIRSSHVSGDPEPPQPFGHNLRGALSSPTEWLIQAAEQQHQEISQLANDHLASMLPPVMQRGESDSQLNLESSRESQPCLSRSNSEGYLLQREKQNERKEKENRKGSRTKGYLKMDVKLGGLGADYETIKEKAETIKQQKEYAKQIKEYNLKNIISARKPPPRPENKLVVSRQKALEYARGIPKPKIVLAKPSEQEPKDEKVLARTLNGENLPPISSLESLQNRHEREKQVVAAFKTFHIV